MPLPAKLIFAIARIGQKENYTIAEKLLLITTPNQPRAQNNIIYKLTGKRNHFSFAVLFNLFIRGKAAK